MLHTALVISAYMSMIFIPCACAQWGDVLTAEWRTMRRDLRLDLRRRREGMSEALIRSLRDARAAAQIAALASMAFVEPKPLPRIVFRARKLHLGRPRPRIRPVDSLNFQRAVARVKVRLCQLSEAFRLANTIFDVPMPAFAIAGSPISMASPRVSISSVAPPMVNFGPTRYKEPVAAPAAVVAKPAVSEPIAAPPAIAAQASQPAVTMEDRLTRRLFDQVGAFRRPAKTIMPQEIRPSRIATSTSLPAAIEPTPLLHFPPSATELEALFALDSQEAISSDAVPVALRESSAKISAAA